jgi:mannose-6-phosphate isomerase class I
MHTPDPFLAPLPDELKDFPRGPYNRFPVFCPRQGEIERGFASLALRIQHAIRRGTRVLVIDGFNGVDWIQFRTLLNTRLGTLGISVTWHAIEECMKRPDLIGEHLAPFLGGGDPLFGRVYPFGPDHLFEAEKIAHLRTTVALARSEPARSLTIVSGCCAGLLELWDELWYLDIPKDVIQERARSSLVTNLGDDRPRSFGEFYKRSYFCDWPMLNRVKRRLLPDIGLFIDAQDSTTPTALTGADFRATLHELAESPFRVRPWFFPGPWGGQYMKGHMGLDPTQPNYAWSFELIVPENGITLEKNGSRLEFSFDLLMYAEHRKVLGEEAGRQFLYEWPIRLDYLDTVDGGHLSTQCHPRLRYIQTRFGETFTQDETYYIVNARSDARVFIGLTEECDPAAFRHALQTSARDGREVQIDRFVHSEPSKPHDLFLIPNGTVHCSGRGNLVLEISATTYIFTFKIYDYLRKDLNGELRPINVDRAFENIRFERRPEWVRENLIARPRMLREGAGWKEYLLMDRPEFFYNIHRLEFEHECSFSTDDKGYAVNLVEGEQISVIAANGHTYTLSYLESMLIPAAAEHVRLVNKGTRPCKLVLVYVRPGVGYTLPLNAPAT